MTGLPEIAIQFSRWLERRKLIGRGARDADEVAACSDAYRSGWLAALEATEDLCEPPRPASRERD